MEQFLKVGVITSAHGVKGEVKVYPATDNPRRFEKCRQVWMDIEKEDTKSLLEIEGVRFSKNLPIVKFKGLDTREAALAYKGRELYVAREDAVPLGQDEYYIGDLIGIQVYDESGASLGVLTDVIETGANDVYSVASVDGREILLPAIRECILEVDVREGRMRVHVMDGL